MNRRVLAPGEGLRAPLVCWLCLTAATAWTAQAEVGTSDLERCAALDDSAAKLDCFEALTQRAREPGSRSPGRPTVSSEAAAADAVRDTDSSTDTASGSTERQRSKGSAPPDPGGSERAGDESVSRASPDLGIEHLGGTASPDPPDVVSAVVRETWREGDRRLYFRLDNGQLWRQMEPGDFFYPRDRAFDVTIRRGLMGDYQMRAEGRGRMTRIVRVE